jgi:hypothetical protein
MTFLDLDADILAVQRAAWRYLWQKANPRNGLVPDHIDADGIVVSPASIGVTGMALTALPAGVENGWVTRNEAATRALATLRFFAHDAAHYEGFFFHFLDMETGERVWKCEISSVDSSFVFFGGLFCAAYFDRKNGVESEIRALAAEILARAHWNLWCAGADAVCLAYKPERGFSRHRWRGYNEALPTVILGLGAPLYALPAESYAAWTRDYRKKRVYGIETLFARPLFIHLFPHLWLDLRAVRDDWMRQNSLNYFENTRRAIEVQVAWAKRRGKASKWGVSACDGPNLRRNSGYHARGVPFGAFDEVFSPPVCLASLPFAPDLALEAWRYWIEEAPQLSGEWGVLSAIHPPTGWTSGFFGLDATMLVLMLENARSGLLWNLSRQIPQLQNGLQRAGFS